MPQLWFTSGQSSQSWKGKVSQFTLSALALVVLFSSNCIKTPQPSSAGEAGDISYPDSQSQIWHSTPLQLRELLESTGAVKDTAGAYPSTKHNSKSSPKRDIFQVHHLYPCSQPSSWLTVSRKSITKFYLMAKKAHFSIPSTRSLLVHIFSETPSALSTTPLLPVQLYFQRGQQD